MTALVLAALAASPDVNLVSLEAGAVAVQRPPTWGGVWSVEGLVDGDPATGWCSAADTPAPHAFVFELEQRSALTAVELDATSVEEASNPGISARAVEVWASSSGATDGFKRLGTVALPKAGKATLTLGKDVVARWVRVVITGNHGQKRYTELMELKVLGRKLEPSPKVSLSGTWTLDDGATLYLGEASGELAGCQVRDGAVTPVSGRQEGRGAALNLPGAVALGDDGMLRGHLRGSAAHAVIGRRSSAELDCRAAQDDALLLAALASAPTGLALSGAGFDANDEVKVDERGQLVSLVRLLKAGTIHKARLLVLGRASDPAADELRRCERRAQRLAQLLQARGVASSTVELGFGLLRVGSVQLEPRIEVVRVDR